MRERETDKVKQDGNPQVEDGYIRIANELWDAWMCSRLLSREERVIKVILRFSYGTGKKYALLSKTEIAAFSNMGLSHVGETLASLETKKVIRIDPGQPPGFLNIRLNKHYLDWDVKQNLRKRTDFYRNLKRTLIRNIGSSQIGEDRGSYDSVPGTEAPESGSQVPKSGSGLPETGTSIFRNGNREVPETGSPSSRGRNLCAAEFGEMIDERRSLKTIKDIYEDSIDMSSACMHGENTPATLSQTFLEIVRAYPEFDVRESDLGWFQARVEGNPRYQSIDIKEELHNWADWLETEHRKKEKRSANRFPKSNFKASIANWLKKALEIGAWKGERYGRGKYPERHGTCRRGDQGNDGGRIPPFSDIPPELLA